MKSFILMLTTKEVLMKIVLLALFNFSLAQAASDWKPELTDTCAKLIAYFNSLDITQDPFRVVACVDSTGFVTTISRTKIGQLLYNSERKFKQFIQGKNDKFYYNFQTSAYELSGIEAGRNFQYQYPFIFSDIADLTNDWDSHTFPKTYWTFRPNGIFYGPNELTVYLSDSLSSSDISVGIKTDNYEATAVVPKALLALLACTDAVIIQINNRASSLENYINEQTVLFSQEPSLMKRNKIKSNIQAAQNSLNGIYSLKFQCGV